MAPGIAAVFAAGGLEATIYARRSDAGEQASKTAQEQRRLLVEHDLALSADTQIGSTTDLGDAVAGAEIVVEAISEDVSAKQGLFSEVEDRVEAEVILASTTSGLDIAAISAGARHKARFVVTHFWNPAHLVPLVEVLGGDDADVTMVDDVVSLLCRMGKYPVRLEKYAPGFIGARLQQAVVREAIALLESGVATAEAIDAATRLSFGARFPVLGPLETSDLGGLDVISAIHEYLLPDLDCSREPQKWLQSLVESGNLGVKTGAGFYDWSSRDAAQLAQRRDEELLARIKDLHRHGVLGIG